jgi:hypothetical protein
MTSTSLLVSLPHHDEALAVGRRPDPPSRAGGASGIVMALSRHAVRRPIASAREDAPAVLHIACWIPSDHDTREGLKPMLYRIDWIIDLSETVVPIVGATLAGTWLQYTGCHGKAGTPYIGSDLECHHSLFGRPLQGNAERALGWNGAGDLLTSFSDGL